MAVHEGARYLEAQLASIRAQSVRDFVLLARDDGSRDPSWAILVAAAAADSRLRPSRVARSQGVVATFAALLAEVRTPFFALSDQDDLWHPEHLARGLAALDADPEADLTYSDLELVDEEGRPLGERLWARFGLRPVRGRRPAPLLLRNTVTGATVVARSRLLARALPIPAEVPMHDWWLALAAAAGGGLLPRPTPSVFYRQHPHQLLGARPPGLRTFFRKLKAREETLAGHLRRRRRHLLALHKATRKRFPDAVPRGLGVFYRVPWPLRILLAPLHALVLATLSPEPGLRWIFREVFVNALPSGGTRRVSPAVSTVSVGVSLRADDAMSLAAVVLADRPGGTLSSRPLASFGTEVACVALVTTAGTGECPPWLASWAEGDVGRRAVLLRAPSVAAVRPLLAQAWASRPPRYVLFCDGRTESGPEALACLYSVACRLDAWHAPWTALNIRPANPSPEDDPTLAVCPVLEAAGSLSPWRLWRVMDQEDKELPLLEGDGVLRWISRGGDGPLYRVTGRAPGRV